jgi:hypothetical protein
MGHPAPNTLGKIPPNGNHPTRDAFDSAQVVDPPRTFEKALPEAARRSGSDGFLRRHRGLVGLGIAVALLVALSWGVVAYVDRVGWEFFSKGRDAGAALSTMARALRNRDLVTVEELYAADFQGRGLGLTDLLLVDRQDGVRIYTLQSKGEILQRQAALAEWQAYLAGFASIEEVRLHVHRLEQWRGTDAVVASVRYELIGVPTGEPQAGIDRASFRMHFDASQKPFKLRRAELIAGDRVISARTLFVDVAAEAGVAFVNQYYPAFLDQPLQFGMIRYGPAGITAADYDNDGYDDLFIRVET